MDRFDEMVTEINLTVKGLKLLFVVCEKFFSRAEISVSSCLYGGHDHGLTLNFVIKYVLIGKFQ